MTELGFSEFKSFSRCAESSCVRVIPLPDAAELAVSVCAVLPLRVSELTN